MHCRLRKFLGFRLIFLLPLLFSCLVLLGGCTTYSYYSLPETGGGTAVISGDAIGTDDFGEAIVVLNLDTIDGEVFARPAVPFVYVSMARDRPKNYKQLATRELTVESGLHRFEFNLARKKLDSRYSYDVDLHSIEAALMPNRAYRLTGKVIVGNAIKYWVEDADTGELASQAYYDPEQMSEALRLIDEIEPSNVAGLARLEIAAKGKFANKLFLTSGRDCFNLVEEIRLPMTDEQLEKAILLSPLSIIAKQSLVVTDDGYRSYEDICLDVIEGHVYELQYHRGERGPNSHGPFVDRALWYELWDLTDDKLLQKIDKGELKVKVRGFE
jgi:hypothetical protein